MLGFNWTAYFMARADTRPIAVWSVASAIAFLVCELPLILLYGLDGLAAGTLVLVAVGLAVRGVLPAPAVRRASTSRRTRRGRSSPSIPPVALILALRAPSTTALATEARAVAELALYVLLAVGVRTPTPSARCCARPSDTCAPAPVLVD